MGRILSENLSATDTQGVMGSKCVQEHYRGGFRVHVFKEKNCSPYKSVKHVHVMKEKWRHLVSQRNHQLHPKQLFA